MISSSRVQRNSNMMLFLGISLGFLLEFINVSIGGLTTVLPGGFRLHHIWIGALFIILGFGSHFSFLIGLGFVLVIGDYLEHQRPDGSVAPFW